MSRYSDISYEDKRREERRKYENDVYYDVWRSGRNPDRIDQDRVEDNFYRGATADQAARAEISAQRRQEQRAREEREMAEEMERRQYEQWPDENSDWV